MPLRAGRPEAAAVSWRWSASEAERRDSKPAAGAMRRRGLLQGLVGAAFGGALLVFGMRGLGTTVLVLTSLITLAALLSPTGLYATLHRLFAWTGQVVGRALAWVVLVPLFYLFFYPFGVLLRRGRRDRLKRFFEPAAASYWEPHEGATASSTSRERQY